MNAYFSIGDLVEYCGAAADFQGKIGVVSGLAGGAKRSAFVWCIFGEREVAIAPKHLRLVKNRRKK
jgi:hypothetical protein